MGNFKNMLSYLRVRAGLSQQELANKLGISKSTVSMYENGKRSPSIEMFEAIADILNVDLNLLMGKETPENEEFYYLNEETRKIAQEVYDNPELKILFDASRDATPEDLKVAVNVLEELKKRGKS
jgi:transcriptional regulator with XRE-family HTH domain